MKNTDIGFEKFEEDFIANPNTMYIKPDNLDMTAAMFNQVQEKFPDNAVIALPDEMSLNISETDVLMRFFEAVIKALPNE